MIKDAILHLATGIPNDATIAYAVSLARAFDAHLAGIAFAYEWVSPAMMGDDVTPDLIDRMRRAEATAAQTAIAAFEGAARSEGLSVETHRPTATFVGTA